MRLIYVHQSNRGQVLQGSRRDVHTAVADHAVSTIALVAEEFQPEVVVGSPRLVRGRLSDLLMEDRPTEAIREAWRLAGEVKDAVETGSRVAVICWAGATRSVIVSALAMRRLGVHQDDVLERLVQSCGSEVLFNKTVKEYALSEPT